MEVRKPINVNQMELVSALFEKISAQNPGLQAEFDFSLLNPVIRAVDSLRKDLLSEGDQLFKCGCENEHVDDCELGVYASYEPTEKYREEWQRLVSALQRTGEGGSFSYVELKTIIGGNSGCVKALISEGLSRKLFVRKKDERFYACA